MKRFVRVEFYPPGGVPLYEVKKYELHVDEPDPPDWFDESIKEKVERKLYRRVKKMLVSGERKRLIGGCWILHGEAKVERVINATIKVMYGSSRVGGMWGSSQVGVMCDSSQVGVMYDSSRVGVMCDSSRVGGMHGSSQVGWMHGKARVVEDLRRK